MSRCDHESSSGLGFWGFALALIAGFYILSIEPTPTIQLSADTTTAPPVTEPTTPTTRPPLTGATGSGTVNPDRPRLPNRPAGVEGTIETDDDLAANMRQFAKCMATDPFGPIYCAGKTAGQ